MKIKSYHLETLFYRALFGIPWVWFSKKNVPGKHSSHIGKCMGTKDVYIHGRKGLKTHVGLFNMQCRYIQEESFLWKRLRIDIIFPRLFLQDFNSCDRISWYVIGSPLIILEKKSPRNLNIGLFLRDNLFFMRHSYIDSYYS